MIIRLCLVAVVAACILPQSSNATALMERDISMFGALFQWFETAMEMVFGYFADPKRTGAANGQKRSRSKARVNYDNFHVIRLRPGTDEAVQELENLGEEPGIDFWNPPFLNRTSDIMAPPDVADYLREYLSDKDIEFTVLTKNLEADIKKQNPKIDKRNRSDQLKTDRGHPMTWDRYHRYKDIEAYMDFVAKTSPNLVKVITIGKSAEGRPLKVAKVSAKNHSSNPAIWIDGGMHGREWIAPSTALFILKQLVENYRTNKAVVNGIDWFIMPVANPDGYEFSHTSDRFWRKNRAKKPKESDDYDSDYEEARFFWDDDKSCEGVDLNRNFDFHWGEVGTSDNPCKATYGGKKAFSEPESRALSDFIMKQKDQIKSYITLHAYSQMILVPWGYTKQISNDFGDLMYVGQKALDALQKVYGTAYKIGNSPTLLYPTSGSSDDWAKGKAGIKYSYTIELRDKGTYGFLLPASQIIPTGRETFAALKAIAKHVVAESIK